MMSILSDRSERQDRVVHHQRATLNYAVIIFSVVHQELLQIENKFTSEEIPVVSWLP